MTRLLYPGNKRGAGNNKVIGGGALLAACFLVSQLFLAAASADIDLALSGPGGQAAQSIAGDSGAFAVDMPLARNAVNKITVTARDPQGNAVSREVSITQVSFDSLVIAEVKAEPLPPERVEQLVNDGVIQLDNPANFNVSQFNIVLTIGEKPVAISVPIAVPKLEPEPTGYETYRMPTGEGSGGGGKPQQPPIEIIVFEKILPSRPGEPAPPPIPGVIIIEGKIKSLKEFFSVRLMLMNTSGVFTLADVKANLEFPDAGLTSILPAEGVASLGEILPGNPVQPGQKEKEFIVRGDEIGIKRIKVNFGGKVTGPGIPQDQPIAFNGSASTSVEVKGPPTFQVQVTHPDAVAANVPYELVIDITNTGQSPALYTSLDLDVGADSRLMQCEADSGGNPVCNEVEGPLTRSFGHIYPAQKVRESFTIKPLASGAVSSCLGIADQNIDLQVVAGAKGCLTGQFPPNRATADGSPTVAVLPTPNMFGVSMNSPVTAFFSEKINIGTINSGTNGSFNVTDKSGSLLSGVIRTDEINGKTVAIWQLNDGVTNRFAPNTEYTVEIGENILDLQGYKLTNSWTSKFTTSGELVDDFTAPALSLSVEPPVNPNGVLPGQVVRVNAYASDQGSGVARVELRSKDLSVDGDQLKLIDQRSIAEGEKPPYTFAIDSSKLVFGHTYQLQGTAYDAMGNAQSATLALVVLPNAAPPTIVLPDDDTAGVLNGIGVSLTPKQLTGGVTAVRYYLDAHPAPFATVTIAPYSSSLSTLGLALGTHLLRAVVEDGLGQTGSDSYSFTLLENSNAPSVQLTSPVSGAQLIHGSLFTVSGSAVDPVGLASTKFYLDDPNGTPIALNTGSFSVDTTGLSLGSHTIYLIATNNLNLSNSSNVPGASASFEVINPPPAPPPPAPAISSVSYPENGMVIVSGTTAAGSRVDISNTSLGVTISVYANSSGVFSGTIEAAAGQQLSVVAYDPSQQNKSAPTLAAVIAPPVLNYIELSPKPLNFTSFSDYQDLTVTGHYLGGATVDLTSEATFGSVNTAIASVGSAGRVVPVANGATEIQALVQGKQDQVTVNVNVVTLTELTITPSSLEFSSVNETKQLNVAAHYSDGSVQPLTNGVMFASGNPNVATVNSSGVVKAVGHGATQVTASISGAPAVSVNANVNLGNDTVPAAQILSPANNTEVQRLELVAVTVKASDQVGGVTKITLQTSGAFTHSEVRQVSATLSTTQQFTFAVPADALINGSITLTAIAEDTGGQQSALASIDLKIVDQTAPTVNITAPAAETLYNYGDKVDIGVSASDAVGATEIRYAATGALNFSGKKTFAPVLGAQTAEFSFTVPFGASSPDVQIHAWAKDAAGNEREAAPVPIVLTDADITPPETVVVAISNPGSGATASVSYQVTSGLDDLDHVELFFRRNGIGTFNRFTDSDHGNAEGKFTPQNGAQGTISFDSTKMGGDGAFEFYTVGVDKAKNREGDPKDGLGNIVPDQTAVFNSGQIVALISTATVIGEGDTSFDNQNLRIVGATVTLSGHHSFHNLELLNGAKLVHPESTLTTEYGLDFSVWTLTLDAASSIDTNARGYRGGNQGGNGCAGQTAPGVAGAAERSGGSYGGSGAASSGTTNQTYGSLASPAELGSGGSCGGGYIGGNGGGRIGIRAINIASDGSIMANGQNGGGNNAGSGSGGAINLAVSAISGKGKVQANGAGYQLGGGGGRVAVNFVDISTLDKSLLQALGGIGNTGSGGNGTVFLRGLTEANGTLVVDGQGSATSFSPLPIPPGYVFDNIVIQKSARVVADDPLVVTGSFELKTGSILTHSRGRENGLQIQAAKVNVDETSSIDLTGKGYRGGLRDGRSVCEGETLGGLAGSVERSGASYGGLGGLEGGQPNPAYGTAHNPVYLGSGGSCGGGYIGGNGGGRAAITASRTVTINGAVIAGGQNAGGNNAGSGSGGSIQITTSFLEGTGVVSADGAAYQVGGGGGRIAIFFDYLGEAGKDFAALRNIHAAGGHTGGSSGSAGTVLFKRSGQVYGDLYFDELLANGTAPRWTPLTHIGFGRTQGVSSDGATTTITTDGKVPLLPKGLIGLSFNPDTNQQQTFTILDNTASTITIPKTAIAAVDAEYSAVYRFDNLFLRRGAWLVLGDKLYVGAKLQLAEGSGLTHYDASAAFSSRLDITAGVVEIAADSNIEVSERGYPGGLREGNGSCTGMSAPGIGGSLERSGGSYGGLGNPASNTPNAVYGNITNPLHLGSGGSCGGGYAGGDGGGSVQLVADSMLIDGVIAADGRIGNGNNAGSGSGGSINVQTKTLSGGGIIRANGGAHQVGGGGGRIAVRYQTLGLGAAQIQAVGGQASGSPGGNGTVFLKQDNELNGELVIDGQGKAPAADLSIIPEGYTFDRITLRNQAYAVADYPLQVSDTFSLLNGSVLTHSTGLEDGLNIQTKLLLVDATSRIDVQGRGYLGGVVPGNPSCNGVTNGGQLGAHERSGGSYGGYGFTDSGTGTNSTYGDPRNPAELGSGGSCGGGYRGGNGGGRVSIAASGTMEVEGLINADGNGGAGSNAGSGSGGAVKITASTLSGAGRITANGGGYQVGGGGGRIAVRYAALGVDASNFEVKGGQGGGSADGGNGTLYLKSAAQQNGDLIIDGLNTDTPLNLSPIPGGYTFDNITLRNKAQVTADNPLTVSGTLTLAGNSVLTHTRGLESGMTIRAGDLVIDSTSRIDASGRGYLGGCRGPLGARGETLGGLAGARERSGGSYGGLGDYETAETNPAYGTPQEPVFLGSGGSCGGGYAGGNGGGRLDIEAANSVLVNGLIAADGDAGNGNNAGSGSGGSIWVRTALFHGSGSIHANGNSFQVAGGGGRIAVNYETLRTSGDDLGGLRNVVARGGHNGVNSGSAGTVLFKQNAQQCGDLYLDEELSSGISPRYTPLTHIGFGTIMDVVSDATTTTVTTDGKVETVPGALVGLQFNPDTSQTAAFEVLSNTANTITIAKTPLAQLGNAYSGVYCFDNVTLRRGAFVVCDDKVNVINQMQIAENSVLTHYDARGSGFTARLDLILGSLQILAGSSINVDGRGYVGGCTDGYGASGQTIPGLTGSTERSGGSYGGRGVNSSGVSNLTYGASLNPNELGSGGSCGGGYGGGDGGGLVKLVVGDLSVNGTISANGSGGGGNNAGSGSGGGINILANTLNGTGTIRADGAGYQIGGGGGRVYLGISGASGFTGSATANGGSSLGGVGAAGSVVVE